MIKRLLCWFFSSHVWGNACITSDGWVYGRCQLCGAVKATDMEPMRPIGYTEKKP